MSVSDQLREAILTAQKSGLSITTLAKLTNMNKAGLHRFVKRESGINSESVDRLTAFFQLTLTPKESDG